MGNTQKKQATTASYDSAICVAAYPSDFSRTYEQLLLVLPITSDFIKVACSSTAIFRRTRTLAALLQGNQRNANQIWYPSVYLERNPSWLLGVMENCLPLIAYPQPREAISTPQYETILKTGPLFFGQKVPYQLIGWATYASTSEAYPELNEPDDNILLGWGASPLRDGWLVL